MSNSVAIAVASRSFSQDSFLRHELQKKYSNVKFNESGKSLAGDQLVDFLKGAEKAIIALEKIDDAILRALPGLKLISKYGVGLDNINLSDFRKNNVLLSWQGGVNAPSVAELALHFILGVCHASFLSHHEIKGGTWRQIKGTNLDGLSVGILGLGHVGQRLVQLLKPFKVKINAFDCNDKKDFCEAHGLAQVGLDELLETSDIVSVHLPLTPKTKGILSSDKLLKLKPGAFLVNTARGGLVDEVALAELLQKERIAFAAFDVFAVEPPVNNPLVDLKNFYVTSHIGGSSQQSIRSMGIAAIQGLDKGREASAENFFDYPYE